MCGLSFCEGSDRALDIFGGHDIWKAPPDRDPKILAGGKNSKKWTLTTGPPLLWVTHNKTGYPRISFRMPSCTPVSIFPTFSPLV